MSERVNSIDCDEALPREGDCERHLPWPSTWCVSWGKVRTVRTVAPRGIVSRGATVLIRSAPSPVYHGREPTPNRFNSCGVDFPFRIFAGPCYWPRANLCTGQDLLLPSQRRCRVHVFEGICGIILMHHRVVDSRFETLVSRPTAALRGLVPPVGCFVAVCVYSVAN